MSIEVAVFQADCAGLSVSQRLERLRDMVAATAADLVVCPELFMSGYNCPDEIPARAQEMCGEFFDRVAALAKRTRTAIIYGYPERAGDKLFNSALCIDKNGMFLANHRKLACPPGFETALFDVGDGMTVFTLEGFRIAILICYDAEFPETVRAAARAGAEVVVVPTALSRQWSSVARQLMPTRGFENGVWLVYANHAGTENGVTYAGSSCIVAPTGKDAARASVDEQIISGPLDHTQVESARKRLPYLEELAELGPKLR